MNAKQKKELIKVLANDCELNGHYKLGKKTCAVGALILHAAPRRKDVRNLMKRHNSKHIWADELALMREVVCEYFGLSEGRLEKIQDANDSVVGKSKKDVESRRLEVLAVVNKFSVRKG